MIGKAWGLIAALALLAGCGPLRDARDAARGVDDAVTLLQDLDDRGAWEALRDGATALEDLNHGYAAALQVQTAGAALLAVEIQADSDDEARITLTESGAGSTETYYVSTWRGGATPADVYRLTDGRYACANAEAEFLRGGLSATLQHVGEGALEPALLAVRAREGDEVTVLEREATRYALESRRAEAIEVLRELDNGELAGRVESAGEYSLEGTITLDDATGALLAAESAASLPDGAGEVRLSYRVIQWAGPDDIPTPGAEAITQPCP